jgi:hypothetical protein
VNDPAFAHDLVSASFERLARGCHGRADAATYTKI